MHRVTLGDVDVARFALTASAQFAQLHTPLHQSADRGTAICDFIWACTRLER